MALSGEDLSLCMSAQPSIAIDPNSPKTVAVAQFLNLVVSFDAARSFPVSLTAPGADPAGHPSLAFDSSGRLFMSYLCNASGGKRSVCLSGFVCDPTRPACELLPGTWPVDVSAASGAVGEDDRPWLGADSTPGSPFRDQLYLIWTRLGTSPERILFSSSSDQGRTWAAAQTLSAGDPGKYGPSHVAVALSGRVYTAWHHQPGFLDAGELVPDGVSGQVAFRKSDDGGARFGPASFPFPPGLADVTWNVQHQAHGVVPGAPMWLFGTVQPWILPSPLDSRRVLVATTDDFDDDVDSADAARVMMTLSIDNGVTWNFPGQPGLFPDSFQVFPAAAIDPISGAAGVAWYDSRDQEDRNGDGVFELDVMAIRTLGSTSWWPEFDMNDGKIDPKRASRCRFCGSDAVTEQECGTPACPEPATTRMGDHIGVAYGECELYVVWTDNAAPSCGGDFSVWIDHQPDLGYDVQHPVLRCPADVTVACATVGDPSVAGRPTAVDKCDLDPLVYYYQRDVPGDCPLGKLRARIDRSWSAEDAAGNSASCLQRIWLEDLEPPALNLPPAVALECSAPGGAPASDPAVAAWLASFVPVDVCGSVTASDDAPPFFPSGCAPAGVATTVTFRAIDDCGNASEGQAVAKVVDSTPPVVSAPAPLRLECNVEGGVGSTDPAILGWLALASGSDVCSAASLSYVVPALFPAGCAPTGGVTEVMFTATDACGNAAHQSSEVAVADTTPPALACSVAITSLWPPNNKLIDVGLSVASDDLCDAKPPAVTVIVTSDEATGGGSKCPDAVIGPGPSLKLRAERAGNGDGRVYRIRVQARDSCANVAACELTVEVRHDADGGPAIDSGQVHDATACE